MKRSIEIAGVLASGLSLWLSGRLVDWVIPRYREVVREILGSEDRLPRLTTALYEYSGIAAAVLVGLSVALVGAGGLVFWKRRKIFDLFAVITMAFTVPLIFVFLSSVIFALAIPIIDLIIKVAG